MNQLLTTFVPRFRAMLISAAGIACALLISCKRAENEPPPMRSNSAVHAAFASSTALPASALAHQRSLVASRDPALALNGLSDIAKRAQTIALAHPGLKQELSAGGRQLRAEVFSVTALRESDLRPEFSDCLRLGCQRVDIYDFARNQTVIGIVDPTQGRVLAWRADAGFQPEIPDRLKAIAIDLALASPEVKEALGGIQPKSSDAQMASTKTALNGTRCERSLHLCAAPTFVQGNIAVWAIVDLADFRVAGVQWTDLGERPDARALAKFQTTERSVADLAMRQKYCERNTPIERNGWRLNYGLTASDGLRISEVTYKNNPMLASVKLVDWHVSYSEREGFGYADAIGCPSFSSAAVVPFAPPEVRDLAEDGSVVGFELIQEFRSAGWPAACNYSYQQRYQFYDDGRFRPSAASIGAGCGNDGTYRPILRIEPADKDWQLLHADQTSITHEQYFPVGNKTQTGARFVLKRGNFRWAIEPGRGQFSDAGRGDFEYVYATAKSTGDEGESDLLSLGSCCNTNHEQGPEKFINAPPEPLARGLVLWYVSQMKNDLRAGQEYCWATTEVINGLPKARTYPCIAGPLFRPMP